MTKQKLDESKLSYFTEDQFEREDFSPPSNWRVRDAMGGRMYFLVRNRQAAQALCDWYYGLLGGKSKYNVILDAPAQIR